jgi:SnoaL-like domain
MIRVGLFFIPALTMLCASAAHAEPVKRGWAHAENIVELGKNQPPSRARKADDVLQIQELLSRWGIAYDEGRLEVIESLFTPDATFQVTLASAKPIGQATGRKQIVDSVRSAMAQQGDQRRHALTNFIVDQTSKDKASIMAYGIVALANELPIIGATVMYSADAVKQGGVWRLSRLVIAMDAYVGTAPRHE